MDYLTFGEGPKSASGLTKSWYVSSIGSQLGYVKWYAPWRKYCYFPAQDIILDEHCLADIAGFCRTETILHKEKLLLNLKRTKCSAGREREYRWGSSCRYRGLPGMTG